MSTLKYNNITWESFKNFVKQFDIDNNIVFAEITLTMKTKEDALIEELHQKRTPLTEEQIKQVLKIKD